jgi:hypothetical protein
MRLTWDSSGRTPIGPRRSPGSKPGPAAQLYHRPGALRRDGLAARLRLPRLPGALAEPGGPARRAAGRSGASCAGPRPGRAGRRHAIAADVLMAVVFGWLVDPAVGSLAATPGSAAAAAVVLATGSVLTALMGAEGCVAAFLAAVTPHMALSCSSCRSAAGSRRTTRPRPTISIGVGLFALVLGHGVRLVAPRLPGRARRPAGRPRPRPPPSRPSSPWSATSCARRSAPSSAGPADLSRHVADAAGPRQGHPDRRRRGDDARPAQRPARLSRRSRPAG